MMKINKKEIVKRLKSEGFKDIYTWKDKPDEIYEPHAHSYETKLIILNGSMSLKIKGKLCKLKTGDSILIERNISHSAKIGEEGCEYIVGEGVKLK